MLLIFYTCNLVFFLIAPVTSREREVRERESGREDGEEGNVRFHRIRVLTKVIRLGQVLLFL